MSATDQDVRDRIRDDLDATLLVDAGAGTGKTTSLVARITQLVRTGAAPIDAIAAITFTEAAARELRHRVRSELERALAHEPEDDRLIRAVAGIDDATFTTLHAFALSILREHALAAGLPPRIEVLTPVQEEIAFDHRWEVFLDGLFGEPRFQRLIGRVHRLGVSPTGLRDIAARLHQDQDRLDELGEAPADLPDPDIREVLTAGRKLMATRERCIDDRDKLAAHLDAVVRPWLDAVAGMQGERLLGELLDHPKIRPTVKSGAKEAWPGCKELVHEACAAVEQALARVREEQSEALARILVAHLGRFVSRWADDRRRSGRLVFADLLVLARDLVRDDGSVRAAVRNRYRHLLVDEFQDTDPIQYDLATSLSASRPGGPLEAGRLFVVGDPKQSIYGFRRADLGTYERATSPASGLETVDLVQNFRSRPAIIDWVNTAFTHLIEAEPGSQPAYVPLVAHRDASSSPSGVRWFGGAHDGLLASDVRLREAVEAAGVIRRLIEEGADPATIAILVRRHGTVRLLERSLTDAGLPYRIASRSLIHETDEVRGLTELLAAIADPADEVAVVASLRHPALGCSDRDLVEYRAAGGSWQLDAATPASLPAGHPVVSAIRRLRRWVGRARTRRLGALVDELVADLGLREIAFAHDRPRDRWRRYAYVADQARAFDDAGGHLRGFVRHLHREADREVRVDEHVVAGSDDASVSITTIHGAKGLEYDTVVLLGLDQPLTKPPGHLRVAWGDDGEPPELSVHRELRTAGFPDRYRASVRRFQHEEVRLLYVGATRAREQLIVSRHHKAGTDCHASRLDALAEVLEPLWTVIEPSTRVAGEAPATAAAADEQLRAARRDEARFIEERQRLLEGARVPTSLTATELSRALADAPGRPSVVTWTTEDAEPVAGAPLGVEVGRAVHDVLQHIALDAAPSGDAVVAAAGAAAARHGVPEHARTIAQLVGNALRAPSMQAAAVAPRVHRELPLGLALGPVGGSATLEGTVDLLYRRADGWVIVDHKTDRAAEDDVGERSRRYRGQVGAYAYALRRLLGPEEPVVEAVLVFARDGSEVRFPHAELDAAVSDVAAHLDRACSPSPQGS